MEKVLHSIFFFGGINVLPVKPEEFLPSEMVTAFKKNYPKPFQEYNTHLPTQTPYSIVLEMVEKYSGSIDVLERLRTWNNRVNGKIINNFVSTVVSYCWPQGGRCYYGASLSCFGLMEAKTMIAISCFKTWHPAIGWVVSTCQRQKANLKFSPGVHSTAVRMKFRSTANDKLLPPCFKCHSMFQNVVYEPKYSSDDTEDQNEPPWSHGNCAESESFSKLLNADSTVSSDTKAHIGGTLQAIENITLETDPLEKQIRNIGARQFKLPRNSSLKFFS
eukprot:gi/632943186/ref/XP_007886817.1/ PREDICTED: uncharacterized protein LOC103175533 isoform X2 [Callorhinchus milii]